MPFELIDIESWERKEFYRHFINEVVCTYSVTVNIDITNLKRRAALSYFDMASDQKCKQHATVSYRTYRRGLGNI